MSSSSDDDDSGFAVYTNAAKNLKDMKRLYMQSEVDKQSIAFPSESKVDPDETSQEIPSLSPPKQRKTTVDESLILLSDDEFQEPTTTRSKRSTRSNSSLQREEPLPAVNLPTPRGRGRRNRGGRGRAIDSQRTAASIELLSNPIPTHIPRVAGNWSFEDVSFEDSFAEEQDENIEINVKVCWKSGKIYKFPIRKYQKLSSIFEYFANLEDVPQSQILMSLRDNIISRDDTPDTLKLTIANIIEGGIVTENSVAISKPVLADTDEDTIELKIRTRDSKTSIAVTLQKTQKMSVMMTKYSEQMEIPLDKLKFSFDGDALDPNETPEDLDLEGGEMIDLVVSK